MASLPRRLKSIAYSLIVASIFTLSCIALQHSSQLIIYFSDLGIRFNRESLTNWKTKKFNLPAGDYYISFGRPRAPCDLLMNGSSIATTRSPIPEIRNELMLGSGFAIAANDLPTELELKCEVQSGFAGDLTHEPVVTAHTSGVIIQLWREFTETIMGPFSILMLLIPFAFRNLGILTSSKRNYKKDSSTIRDLLPGLASVVFVLTAFCYSTSLAYYPRLFIRGFSASVLHVAVRNAFSLGVLIVCISLVSRTRIIVAILSLIQACLIFAVGLVAKLDPSWFVNFYKIEYLFFPISIALLTLCLFLETARSKNILIFRGVALAWTALLSMETWVLWGGSGTYTAPAFLVFLNGISTYLKISERRRTDRIENAVGRILASISSQLSVNQVLAELAMISSREANFKRVSAYLDAFCLGRCDVPRKRFVRVSEHGYEKDTSKDTIIELGPESGAVMKQAMDSEQMLLRLGADGAWFLVVPLGPHACINLSNDKPGSEFDAYESEEAIRRLLPSLRAIDRRLIEQGMSQSGSFQKLRSKRGDGKWEEVIGSVFADINDYSKFSEHYGAPFTAFVSDAYLPSLIKYLSDYATPEHLKGDEVYFVILGDLLSPGTDINKGTLSAVSLIDAFAREDGASLCESAGFPILTVSIGASCGMATLVCDPVQVRTAGAEVNNAKRLQEAAGREGILLRSQCFVPFDGFAFSFGEEINILQKKNLIQAIRLIRIKQERQIA